MHATSIKSIIHLPGYVKQHRQTASQQLPEPLARDIRRFWSKVDRSSGPDACWLWIATARATNHGMFGYGTPQRVLLASRFAWLITHGQIPAGLCVLHKPVVCRTSLCVNPRHLYIGTHEDNARDRRRAASVQEGGAA